VKATMGESEGPSRRRRRLEMHDFLAADLVRDRQRRAEAGAQAHREHAMGSDRASQAGNRLRMWRFLRRESS